MSITDLLAQATCAVLVNGQVKGTAWLFTHEGHLLTAGHVVDDPDCVEVEVRFAGDKPRTAYRIQRSHDRESGVDYAILRLKEPLPERRPLPITLEKEVSGKFVLLGYGKSLKDRGTGRGVFAGFFDPQNFSGNRLFKLDSKQLGESGYSGGAVFSEESRAVVAIQIEATTARSGAERDTVLAMPLYRIPLGCFIDMDPNPDTLADLGLASREECAAWRRQLAELRSNLLLVEERLSEFVMDTDPANIQLVKRKRKLEKRIAEIENRLSARCEGARDTNPSSTNDRAKQDENPRSGVNIKAQEISPSGKNVIVGQGDITNINVESEAASTNIQQSAGGRETALRRQLAIHRRNLARLEEQLAKYGKMDAPPHLLNRIDDEKAKIRRKKGILEEIGGRDA